MNNRFWGNMTCLTKYDLLIKVATSFSLPVWYITMLTENETRNKGDRNATNYRLGSMNTELLESMKAMFYGDDATMTEICAQLRNQDVDIKMITTRNNHKAGHYRAGYINHFTNAERNGYFESVKSFIDKTTGQIIFLDPDTGIMPFSKKLSSGKGPSFIKSTEIKAIMESVGEDSIIMVQQLLTNYQYTHEARVRDLQQDLQTNVILLVDEVIQSGVYFFPQSNASLKFLTTYLWEYLTQYQFVKSNDRVMLITGTEEGVNVKPLGVPKTPKINSKQNLVTDLNEKAI